MKSLSRTPAIVIFYLLFVSTANAQISWVRIFDDALKQAQGTGKFIVVDIFADWCPPCRTMAQEVYTDSVFINFSRTQIFMLLDGEADPEGLRLSGKFDVHTYPTILVLDSRGQEIDRLIGGRNTKTLMNDLQAIFDNPIPYGELAKKAKANTGDYELQYRAGERAFNRDDFNTARQFLGRAADASNKDAPSRSASLILLSVACFKNGKYPEALTALDDFERTAPDVTARDSELRLLRGRILISAKRYDEGSKVLNELLRSSHSRKEIESARSAVSQLPGKYRKGNQDYESILNNTKKEFQKGKLEAALSLGQRASTLAPQAAEVHMLLAVIHFRMGNNDSDPSQKSQHISTGLNEMRLARRLDPEDMNIYSSAKDILASRYLPQKPELPAAQKSYQEAEAYFAAGRYELAVKAYQKTMELEPGFGKTYLHCGDCFFATGKIDEALKLYQQAIVKNPIDASAYRFAADALRKLGKADEARRYLKSALLADPEYPMIWRDLEQIAYAEGGQFGRHTDLVPIQFLLLGIDTSTYDESLYDNLPALTVPAWKEYVRSKLLWRQERFTKAFPHEAFYHASFEEELESLQAAIRKWNSLKAQDASIRDESLDFLRQISVDEQLPAFIYLELFTEEYRNSYEKWKKENPETALNYIDSYLTGRAGIISRGEYNSSAMEAFNSALSSQKAGNNEQARNLYLKALAQAPEMVPALRNLSILYLEMSDFENARENLEKWSALEPNASDPMVMLSQLQARGGDFDAAAILVEKALKLETDPAKRSQYQKILASMQSMSGRNGRNALSRNQPEEDADDSEDSGDRLTSLERRFESLKDGEERDSLMLTLAIAHFESRNWSQARRYASMLLAKDPSQPTAKSIMENLRDKN
jgi:tetratricopeptide (TPR) repeat protein